VTYLNITNANLPVNLFFSSVQMMVNVLFSDLTVHCKIFLEADLFALHGLVLILLIIYMNSGHRQNNVTITPNLARCSLQLCYRYHKASSDKSIQA